MHGRRASRWQRVHVKSVGLHAVQSMMNVISIASGNFVENWLYPRSDMKKALMELSAELTSRVILVEKDNFGREVV